MAGQIRLFEKTTDDLLVEVAPEKATKLREGRRVSHINIAIDVLWTPEEETAADAEMQRQVERAETATAAALAVEKRRAELATKFGLTPESLDLLFGKTR